MPVLRADAQFTVAEAALKGYIKWRSVSFQKGLDNTEQREAMEDFLENWCKGLLQRDIQVCITNQRH